MVSSWKRALIVGASSGIGEAIARKLARGGCRVALVARRKDVLDRIAGEINQEAGSRLALAYAHDVRDYEAVPALLQQIANDMSGLDLVIYSAGVMPTVPAHDFTFATDRNILETNLVGASAWLNAAAERFQRVHGGTIVGISSVAGERGRRGLRAYAASKAGLTAYLEALRNALAGTGVKVVTVKPGPVDTPMTQGMRAPMMITADRAADMTLAAARRGAANAYVPGVWRWVFLALRNIPSFLFKKLSF